MTVPTYDQAKVDFEREWARTYQVWGLRLAPKTLTAVKQMARYIYLQGRMDGVAAVTTAHIKYREGMK